MNVQAAALLRLNFPFVIAAVAPVAPVHVLVAIVPTELIVILHLTQPAPLLVAEIE